MIDGESFSIRGKEDLVGVVEEEEQQQQ